MGEDTQKSIGRLEGKLEVTISSLAEVQKDVKEIKSAIFEDIAASAVKTTQIQADLAEHMRRSHALEHQNVLTEERLELYRSDLFQKIEPLQKAHQKALTVWEFSKVTWKVFCWSAGAVAGVAGFAVLVTKFLASIGLL